MKGIKINQGQLTYYLCVRPFFRKILTKLRNLTIELQLAGLEIDFSLLFCSIYIEKEEEGRRVGLVERGTLTQPLRARLEGGFRNIILEIFELEF